MNIFWEFQLKSLQRSHFCDETKECYQAIRLKDGSSLMIVVNKQKFLRKYIILPLVELLTITIKNFKIRNSQNLTYFSETNDIKNFRPIQLSKVSTCFLAKASLFLPESFLKFRSCSYIVSFNYTKPVTFSSHFSNYR